MKKILMKIRKSPNTLLFALYLGTISNIKIFTLISNTLLESIPARIIFIITCLFVYFLSFLVSNYLLKKIQKINIPQTKKIDKKNRIIIFFIFFATTLLVSIIWFLAYNPGGFSNDSLDQYNQAITNNYSDWHPVIHTLIFFKIPISIFQTPSSIVLCQIIIFCLAVSYSLVTIHEYAGKKWSIASAIFILANPLSMSILMYPWKDAALGIFGLLIVTISLKIYLTKGHWANSNIHIIFLAVLLCLASLVRHNAILFSIPLIIALFFFMKPSQWIKLVAITALSIFLIKVPLYSSLKVAQPENRTTETMGAPLAIIGNVVKTAPDVMDEELANFAYSIAPESMWEEKYNTGDFNSIKWSSNLQPIEEAGVFNVAKYTIKAIVKSPIVSLDAFFKLTQVVYDVEKNDQIYYITPKVDDNDLSIEEGGIPILKSTLKAYRKIVDNTILRYFTAIGSVILIMIICILGKNNWKKGGWKKILLCSPILIYDFGTMLFLTSPEVRFFYINFLVCPIIILLTIKKPEKLNTHTKNTQSL